MFDIEITYLVEAMALLLLILAIGYAILDGFDLGVGALHLFAKGDYERRVSLNSIGPVWDGNEVWLICLVGALFAGFPHAYAQILSTFYLGFMFLLFTLIFRAVAIEFRSKQAMKWWRSTWDVLFSVASIGIALLMGIIIGNLIQGVPLDSQFVYLGKPQDHVSWYSFMIGVTTLSLFMMHGSIYLVMKTEGAYQRRIITLSKRCIIFFVIMYAFSVMTTLVHFPHMADRAREHPFIFGLGLLSVLLIANIPRRIQQERYMRAFLSSCGNIACILTLFATGTFPYLLRSTFKTDTNSLTIFNADSSAMTIKIVFIIALIGMPLVLAYTFGVYRIFRGKVRLDSASY